MRSRYNSLLVAVLLGTACGEAGAGSEQGDADSDAAAPRRCAAAAAAASTTQPTWQRIEAGLDDFRFTFDRSGSAPPVADTAAHGFAGVAYGNGLWLALGGGNIRTDVIRYATSRDGVHWEPATLQSMRGEIASNSRVYFVHGQFAFFVEHGAYPAIPRPVLYTSGDGRTWSHKDLQAQPAFVFDLASSETLVALAGGNLWTSPDLDAWSETSFDTGNPLAGITSVEFGAGRWVAIGARWSVVDDVYRGELLAWGSADGIDWQRLVLTGEEGFHVEYGDGLWVAANPVGELRTSRDGQTFVEVVPTGVWVRPDTPQHRLRYGGGRFLTVAVDTAQQPPPAVRVLSSRDGSSWSNFGAAAGLALPDGATTVDYRIVDIAYADCRYVVAGAYRVVVPGALDPPPFVSEIGPFLITADVAEP